jgi:hypothetical protein
VLLSFIITPQHRNVFVLTNYISFLYKIKYSGIFLGNFDLHKIYITGYSNEASGVGFRSPVGVEIFLFIVVSRSALGLTQPPTDRETWGLFARGKAAGS